MLAILIPSRGSVAIEWALRLRELQLPDDSTILTETRLPLDQARDDLVRRALEAGADRILFLDDDVLPPTDAPQRLLQAQGAPPPDPPTPAPDQGFTPAARETGERRFGELGLFPVLSALYWLRSGRACAMDYDTQLREIPDINDGVPGIRPCDVVGMGCCLIDAAVFVRLDPPWFQWPLDPITGFDRGEDVTFSLRLKELGVRPAVDTRVRCEHLTPARRSGHGELLPR